MCVKSCLCNSCYKRKTCTDCECNSEHKEVDCLTEGIVKCDNYIVRKSQSMNRKENIIGKDKILTVDINVKQRPVSVEFECPHCEEEIEVDYEDFCIETGEPCDWSYSKIQCPKCGKTLEIDSVDWD